MKHSYLKKRLFYSWRCLALLNQLFTHLYEHVKDIENYASEIKKEVERLDKIQNDLADEVANSRYHAVEIYYKIREIKEIRQLRRSLKRELLKIDEVSYSLSDIKRKIETSSRKLDDLSKHHGDYHGNWIVDREQILKDIYVEKTNF